MPKTNDAALDAFIAAKNEIDAMLARLVAHSADHFGYSPEEGELGPCRHAGPLPRAPPRNHRYGVLRRRARRLNISTD